MADEKKTTQQAQTEVKESTAYDDSRIIHGRPALKTGYEYQYVTGRGKNGERVTTKVIKKAGS